MVCQSVRHDREPCKNGWTVPDAVWGVDLVGPWGWGFRSPCRGVILRVKGVAHCSSSSSSRSSSSSSAGVLIWLEQGASDLHIQLMPLLPCRLFSIEIQNGFNLSGPGLPRLSRKEAVKWVSVYVLSYYGVVCFVPKILPCPSKRYAWPVSLTDISYQWLGSSQPTKGVLSSDRSPIAWLYPVVNNKVPVMC